MANKQDTQTEGMSKGLTQYGDPGFSLFLRKAFIKGAGYSDTALDRPVIGIANTGSAYNPCHGNAPQLIEAIEPLPPMPILQTQRCRQQLTGK